MGNVSSSGSDNLWLDSIVGLDANEAIPKIRSSTRAYEKMLIDWYWAKIGTLRRLSVGGRVVAIFFLSVGGLLPIISGFWDEPAARLAFAQAGIACLGLAGAIQLADKALGWSAGWMRYITTVMEMESLVMKFGYQWTLYLETNLEPSRNDVVKLVEMATEHTASLDKLKKIETASWAQDYANTRALLEARVKDSLPKD